LSLWKIEFKNLKLLFKKVADPFFSVGSTCKHNNVTMRFSFAIVALAAASASAFAPSTRNPPSIRSVTAKSGSVFEIPSFTFA
jgi:hypothetical protein